MFFTFEPQKAVQAAGVLLRAHHHRMSYLRLLKLLYIADREGYKTAGRPIIGNQPVAMDNGPLHSEVYDLIKGEHSLEEQWSPFIARDGYLVELLQDPGVLDLSRHEIQLLNEVAERYRNDDDWTLVELTHQFPEWKKNWQKGSSTRIPLEDILEGVGLPLAERTEMLAELEEEKRYEQLVKSQRSTAVS